ncbi:hypothetical protein L873DRAFT_1817732 [Choiromyces venosus 120613-1]|uniref:Uncharacterized protein n=1 Tax=Choiromyces venosus 120613-1 TaxID=1336337 RepID=A0A3N4J2L7_9PEZI|nr:hypothetical protein L873DRAFT_1817732 [Choiromyces venosus 120613-1]
MRGPSPDMSLILLTSFMRGWVAFWMGTLVGENIVALMHQRAHALSTEGASNEYLATSQDRFQDSEEYKRLYESAGNKYCEYLNSSPGTNVGTLDTNGELIHDRL